MKETTMTNPEPPTPWVDTYAAQLERRIAAALVHLGRARLHAVGAEVHADLALAIDALRGEVTT